MGHIDQHASWDADRNAWCREQAERLRESGPLLEEAGLDWQKIAEELDSLSASDRRELASRLRVIIAHLLKWMFAADLVRQLGANGWQNTLEEQRVQIDAIFDENPSLRRYVAGVFDKSYVIARKAAARELKIDIKAIPNQPPFTIDDVLNPAYPPGMFPDEDD